MLFPGDAYDDLIQVPFVARARRALTNAVGEFLPEFEAPLPDRFVRYRDAAGGRRNYQEFRAGLGMIGAKEPNDATPQRTSYS